MKKEEETKCYCGHTTTCDCGPEELEILETPMPIYKQETLEEVAERLYPIKYQSYMEDYIDINYDERQGFIEGAKWQQERSYSEKDVIDLLLARDIELNSFGGIDKAKEWFKQFKKI